MSVSLADQLQIWGFESGLTLFGDGSLGFGVELIPLDVSCWDDGRIDQFAARLGHFLNALPSGIDIQFLQEIGSGNEKKLAENEKLGEGNSNPVAVALHKERLELLRLQDSQGQLPRHSLKLFVRRLPPDNLIQKPKLFSKPKQFSEMTQAVLEREINATLHLQQDVIRSLTSLDFNPSILSEKETTELLYWQWNPTRSIGLNGYDPEDIRSSLVFTDVVIHPTSFTLGKLFHRVVSLKLLPDETFATMARALRNLPFDSKLFLSIRIPDQQKELENLQLQRRVAFSVARGKKSGVADIESEAKLQDLETLVSELVSQGEKVFHVSLNVLLRSTSENDLDEQVSQTLMVLRELSNAEGMEESLAAFDIFSEFAVPNARAKERAKRIKTSNVCDLLPLYGPWLGNERPRVLLKSTQGSLIGFDLFSKNFSNHNQIIAGGSGSGKSFLTNLLLLQLLKENPKVFILDIGGSYKKLSENLSGQYLPLNLGTDFSINPFDLSTGETVPSSQKIKFLVGLVEMMTKEEEQNRVGRLERAEIEAAIVNVYKDKAPCLSSLKEVLLAHRDPSIQRLGKILAPWCGNTPFGKILDRKTTIELQRSIVCFDLKGLETTPDLQAVCLYIITDYIWREIQKDRSTIKLLIFDECWKLLENEAAASFIAEVFRTIRKYFGSAIAISQIIDDYARSKIGAAIIPNTSIKWILMQKGADQARLKEVLQLNDTEMAQIAALHQERGSHSQAFLMAEDKHCTIQIEPTPLEYWIGTTDPRDLAVIEAAQKNEPQKSALEVLQALSKKYPGGMLGRTISEGASQ